MKQYFKWIFVFIASLTMVSAYADETDEVATAEEVTKVEESNANEDESLAVVIDDEDADEE